MKSQKTTTVRNRQVVEDPVTMLVSIRQRPIQHPIYCLIKNPTQKTAGFVAANWSISTAADNLLVSTAGKRSLLILVAPMVIIFAMNVMAKEPSIP